ncbi:MerR family transcriptional regulator [Ktedonobacter sp. SOSP1-52]|uniref:MerR family transcriptional regulator n=1 Tax=Ktedonobacter sp. SOSP1-52 TaxID=2778366 RepID=UPI001F1909E7|nr:MerR family transcriptional regulator [Ktedonobacter sp. SOSP1-52]
MSIPILRYYEDIGLVPDVERDTSSGHRRYRADTLQMLESLANLRAVGMSVEEMRTYLTLVLPGRRDGSRKARPVSGTRRRSGKADCAAAHTPTLPLVESHLLGCSGPW